MAHGDLTETYRQLTPESRQHFEDATEVLPGGDTRSVTYHKPYPSFVRSASGCHLTTVDDERLLDFLNNYTQSVLGHAPEEVVEAVCKQFRQGNCFAAPTEQATELARRLTDRIPSVEQVRFGNSGTEGTMNAVRGAMAYTGKEIVVKAQGGYHGTHDTVEVGVSGHGRENAGIPHGVEERVVTVPYNNPEELKRTMQAVSGEVACFIVEPIMGVGGMIPATEEYLATARDLTESHDAVLVFDEVMSFRMAEGGAQERYGVTPDLTTLGKLIGGGLPIGAFGGREDVMEVFHPEDGTVSHSGTFNANPATMAGGIATLDALDADQIAELNALGEQLRSDLQRVAEDIDHPIQVTGDGSMFQLHFTDDPVTDWESSTAGRDTMEELFLAMRNRGVFLAPRGMGNLSTPMTEAEIEQFVETFEDAMASITG